MDLQRPSREQALMETAHVWAKRSTCSRNHVGAVIAREGRILSQGYNGAPAGMPHCNHTCACDHKGLAPCSVCHGCGERRGDWMGPTRQRPNPDPCIECKGSGADHSSDCPSKLPCTISVHAEANAIAWAARYGMKLEGAELFTTLSPCPSCAMLIINAGIVRVTYNKPYRVTDGVELLDDAGVEVIHFT